EEGVVRGPHHHAHLPALPGELRLPVGEPVDHALEEKGGGWRGIAREKRRLIADTARNRWGASGIDGQHGGIDPPAEQQQTHRCERGIESPLMSRIEAGALPY